MTAPPDDTADFFVILPSAQYGVWRIKVPHDPDLYDIIGNEFVLTSHPLSVAAEVIKDKIKRAYPWCLVHIIKFDGSVVCDEAKN